MDLNSPLSPRARRTAENRKFSFSAARSRGLAAFYLVSRNLYTFLATPEKSRLILIIFLGYVAVTLLTGFLRRPVLEPRVFATFMDYHYGVVFGAARKLQLGIEPSGVRFNFGILSAFVASWIAKAFAFKEIGDWMRMSQAFQFVFFIFTAVSAWFIGKGNVRLVAVVTLVLFPWIHTTDSSILAPNQSGFRFLAFSLVPIAIAVLSKTCNLPMIFAGAAFGGFFLLWNPETGVACTAALAFYALIRVYSEHGGSRWKSLAATVALVCLATAIMFAGACALFGSFLQLNQVLDHLIGISGGYGGLKLKLDSVLAGLAALLASFLVIFCCSEAARARAKISVDVIERAALGVAAIIWFAYYANRPAFWNLWTILLLLSFTASPLIMARLSRHTFMIWSLATGAVIYSYYFEHRALSAPFVKDPSIFQGVITSEWHAKFLSMQAVHLRFADSKTVFFSSSPFTLSIESGRANDISVFDPFAETWTAEGFAYLMGEIYALPASCILVETKESPALDEYRQAFFARVRSDLIDRFDLIGVNFGWDIFRAKHSNANC
jgi:hypothetical protein